MRIDRVAIALVRITPDRIEQLRTGIDAAGMLRKAEQQVEFARGQDDRGSGHRDPAAVDIDHEILAVQHHAAWGVDARGVGIGSAAQRMHARQQLAHAKRLGQIIIRAQLETAHAVGLH